MVPDVDGSALFRAVLSNECSDETAREHIARALALQLDPLDYAAHRFGLGNDRVWQGAAQWAGYGFVPRLPEGGTGTAPIDRLDRLAHIRSLRQSTGDGDTIYVAPRFEQVLALRRARRDAAAVPIRFTSPDAIERALAAAASEQLLAAARQGVTQIWPHASAAIGLPLAVRIGFVAAIVALILVVLLSGLVARPFLIPVVALILMTPGVMRLAAAIPAAPRPDPPRLADAELPPYSVLIPLRDESQMVPLLRRAMAALDYPSHLLDIRFVVEARSPETVAAVEAVLDDPRFRMVVVPHAAPHTKPKAIDYALPFARGEFVVVYDAEDVPDPDQLRRAAERFRADPHLACLQAELVPENAHENLLTALFAGEYAGLFGRLLPALARWGLPVPLGGTSNHFRTAVLRDLGGWDAFNVTEDADLGVRLARRGLRAEAFASRTHEEAPVSLRAWMAQRTRWMKGWMQTFIVHNRRPDLFLRDIGWKGFVGFQVLVGGMILSSLLHTVFIGAMLGRLMLDGVAGFVPQDGWDWFAVGVLAAGYGGAFAVVVSGLAHLRAWHLLPMQIVLPAYWILHSVAALFAARELILRPMHWAKTTHGVTRVARGHEALPQMAVLKPRTG